MSIEEIAKQVQVANRPFLKAREEIQRVIVGQTGVIDQLLVALLSDGHVIIEGLPGLAKTLIANTLARVIQCDFKRIQFTPDLLPADLIGTSIYSPKEGSFQVSQGPIFTQILLADEINRAPAKVQSALLEVMQEKQVTISGKTFHAKEPYMVLATQNPIEQEGTYPLPEAQTDRFMLKVRIGYPSREEEEMILERMATLGKVPEAKGILKGEEVLKGRSVVDQIYIDDSITRYILDLVLATRHPKEYQVDIAGLLQFGASPRASMALKLASKAQAFLAGRGYVKPEDVKAIGHAVFRHRLRLSYEAEAEEKSADQIIDRLFETIPVP